jgi:hypothetical protein
MRSSRSVQVAVFSGDWIDYRLYRMRLKASLGSIGFVLKNNVGQGVITPASSNSGSSSSAGSREQVQADEKGEKAEEQEQLKRSAWDIVLRSLPSKLQEGILQYEGDAQAVVDWMDILHDSQNKASRVDLLAEITSVTFSGEDFLGYENKLNALWGKAFAASLDIKPADKLEQLLHGMKGWRGMVRVGLRWYTSVKAWS